MKTSDIKVGETYVNRGKGRTRRTVIAIGDEHRPPRFYGLVTPSEPGVLYEQNGKQYRLYLCSFAAWAGKKA